MRSHEPADTYAVDVLCGEHRQVEAVLAAVMSSAGRHRLDAFAEVAHLIDVHEAHEQRTVHPVLAGLHPDGAAIAHACLTEERDHYHALRVLRHVNIDDPTFDDRWTDFADRPGEHHRWEEHAAFALLRSRLTTDQLCHMAVSLKGQGRGAGGTHRCVHAAICAAIPR